jgi:hypothetical protein
MQSYIFVVLALVATTFAAPVLVARQEGETTKLEANPALFWGPEDVAATKEGTTVIPY